MKINKKLRGNISNFMIEKGFAYVGKRIIYSDNTKKKIKRSFYQVGFGIMPLRTLYFNLNNKPKIKNLILLNILLFIPFVMVNILYVIKLVVYSIIFTVYYLIVGDIKDGINDFGWGERYCLISIIFWKLLSLYLIYLLIK